MNLLINFLLTIGILLSLAIVFFLLKRKERSINSYSLTGVFFLFFMMLVYSYGEVNNIPAIYTLGFIFADSIGFIIGPLLLIYVHSLFREKPLSSSSMLIHFVPAIIYIAVISIPFLLSIVQNNYTFKYIEFLDTHTIILHLQALYLLGYALYTIFVFKRYNKLLKHNYSNLSGKDLKWVAYLLYGVAIMASIDLIVELFIYLKNLDIIIDMYTTTLFLILVLLYLGYYGISQSRILIPDHFFEDKNEKITIVSSHHLSNASDHEIKVLRKKLHQIMETEKPFLNNNLTLDTLADLILTTDRKLSALLNHHMKTTFYDYVNEARVAEVILKIEENKHNHLTLLGIGYESGFQSKTSFNRIFKKTTGLSPSAYKTKINKDLK